MDYRFPLHRCIIRAPVPGALARQSFDADSRIVETEAGIGNGLACGQGTTDRGAILGASSAAQFVGISMRLQPEGYAHRSCFALLTRGDVWVTVGSVVRAGAAVTFNRTTGVLGAVAPDADNFAIVGARWMSAAQVMDLAIVRLSGTLPAQV